MTLREKLSLTLLILAAAIVGMTAFVNTLAWAPPATQPETTFASWYGEELRGSETSSGEQFDPDALTAAHKTLPLGTMLRVCKYGCTTVRVNDRGPYVAGRDIDLSEAAAESIGLSGVEPVEITETSEPVTELPNTGHR